VRKPVIAAGHIQGLGLAGSRWWAAILTAVVMMCYPHGLRARRLASVLSSFWRISRAGRLLVQP